MIGISAEVFSKAWRGADPRSTVAPTRAFSFRRNAPKAALGLTLVSPGIQASQEIAWQVGPRNPDLTASCALTSAAENLMLIEWQVPANVVLAEVSGPHVRHWSRAGSLLQVWLSGPQKKTRLTLTGWAKNLQPLAGGKGRFDLPNLTLKNQGPVVTLLKVAPSPGLTLQPINLQNLTRSSEEEPGSLSFVLQKQQPANYGGSFLLAAAPVQPQVNILTVAKVHNRALDFTAHLEGRVPHGELRQITIKVDRWPGDDVNLEVLGLADRIVHQNLKNGHAWTVFFPPGIPRQFSCLLSGRRDFAGRAGGKILLPDVHVSEAKESRRFLALIGPDVQGEAVQGLAVVKDFAEPLAKWPAAAKGLVPEGMVWRITQADWNLQVVPRAAPLPSGVQVLLAEQEAVVGDARRWVHQATFLVFAKGGADVRLSLPRGARLLAMALDERAVVPRKTGPEAIWLPLPAAPGPRWLRLRWQYQEESFTSPNLASPNIQCIPAMPVQGTVFVPAGFDAEAAQPAVALMLHRAEAQLELSRLLGDVRLGKPNQLTDREQKLLEAQQRFAWYCRQAEMQASRSGAPSRAVKDLRQKNVLLMAKLDREKTRLRAEKEALWPDAARSDALFALPQEGRPFSWRAQDSNAPRLILTPRSDKETQSALVASEVLLLILVGLGILSCLPRTFAWLQKLWPEQLLLLAWAGWYFFDISLIGLALIVAGISARLIIAATWLQLLVHRTTPPAPGSSLHPAS